LDEDKNECGKTNEDKITAKSIYQISLAVIESDVIIRFTTTSNSPILLCVDEKQGDEPHRTFIRRLIQERNLTSLFPNTDNILPMYLSLICSYCNGERSFSKLKRSKNELRPSLSQQRVRHFFVKPLLSYNSPVARGLFEPSTDSASLLVEMKKNFK